MEAYRSLLSKHKGLLALAALIVLGGAAFWYARSSTNTTDTFVAHASATGPTVSVSGTVKAAQDVDLGFAQSGRVAGVYAQVGDTVAAGAVLAEMENGDVRALVAQKRAALKAAQAKLDSLQAGTRPEELAVTRTTIESDQATLAQAKQSLVDAIQAAYTTADDAVHNKVDQFLDGATGASPSLSFSVSDTARANQFLADRAVAQTLLQRWHTDVDFIVPPVNLDAVADSSQAHLASIAALLAEANGALNAAIPDAATSQQTLDTYTASVAGGRSAVNAAASTLTGARTALASAQAALDRDQKTLALQLAGSTAQDIEAQLAAVAAAQADVESAQAQLRKTLVVAPFAGLVTKMDAKVGEAASPSVSEISMIRSGVFQIECYVPEVNIASVTTGDTARVTLDAYGADTGFGAKIVAIDPAQTVHDGVTTYKTTLQFDAADTRIRPGMTANVVINAAGASARFEVPLGALFEKHGVPYVQLVQGGRVEDVAVTTTDGASFGMAAITSGVHDGDVISLNPDPTK